MCVCVPCGHRCRFYWNVMVNAAIWISYNLNGLAFFFYKWCWCYLVWLRDMMCETNRLAFITHFIWKLSIIIFHVRLNSSCTFYLCFIRLRFLLYYIINIIMSSIQLNGHLYAFNALRKPFANFSIDISFFRIFYFGFDAEVVDAEFVDVEFVDVEFFDADLFWCGVFWMRICFNAYMGKYHRQKNVLKKTKVRHLISVVKEVMEKMPWSLKGIGNNILICWKACNTTETTMQSEDLNLNEKLVCFHDIIWYLKFEM